jgi:hypothetical protein
MKKQVETLREVIDAIFQSINNNHIKKGTGLFFIHKVDSEKMEGTKDTKWSFTIFVSEPGYPSRALQSLSFVKPSGIDRYQMEHHVLMSSLCIFTDSTLLQWNELGKLLNTDKELQKSAKEVIS